MPASDRLIAVKQWLQRTSLTGRTRSASLKALDDALGAYEKERTPARRTDVILRFNAWKAEQGGLEAWRSSPRNQGKPIGAFTELEAMLFLGGDTDEGIGIHSSEALQHRQARLGVMYLFSHMTVSTNMFGLLLDTAGVFAGAFNFQLTGTGQLNGKVASVGEIPQAGGELGAKITSAATFGADKYGRRIPQYAAAGGQKMLGGLEKSVTGDISEAASDKVLGVKDPEAEHTLWTWFWDYVSKQVELLKKRFTTLKGWAPVLNMAVKAIISELWAAGGGLLSDAVKTGKGLEQTLTAFGNRVASAVHMYSVRLVEGYPAAVVDAVHRSMTLSGAEGLYNVARGAGGMAMTAFASPIISKFVNLFLNAAEKLFRFIWRLGEISEMSEFFAVARAQYPLGKAYEAAIAARQQPLPRPPLHARPMAFARWFREAATSIPPIAILTLTSGICGNKMTYLSLYNDDEQLITKEKFINGAKAIDALKPWGHDYLGKSGYTFHTSDTFVSQLLKSQAKNAAALAAANQGMIGKLYDGAMTVLSG